VIGEQRDSPRRVRRGRPAVAGITGGRVLTAVVV
jgi:hypothetical protein